MQLPKFLMPVVSIFSGAFFFGQTVPDHLMCGIGQIMVNIFRIHHIFGIYHLVPIHVAGKQLATLLLLIRY